MLKKLALLAIAGMLSACTTLPKGSVVRISNYSDSSFRSSVTVYNNAGKNVVIIPSSRGEGFVAEYKLGRRHWSCLWLCREKIPTKVFSLRNGEQLTIPMRVNTDAYSAPVPIDLQVYINKRYIGTYNGCVYVPPGRPINPGINFTSEDLWRLKHGNAGHACNHYDWW